MKQQIIRGLFALLALFFTAVSCRKDVQTTAEPTQAKSTIDAVKGDFHVENGILHFDNPQALHDVLEQLRKFDISERRNFGAKIGFTSLLYAYNDVLQKTAAAAEGDEKAYDDILKTNADILSMRNDGTFEMRILNKNLASILNREGIFYVGKVAYRFTDFGETVAIDGDVERLKTVTKLTPSDKNFKVFITNNLAVRSCGVNIWQNGVQNSSGDRAGDLWCTAVFLDLLMVDIFGFPIIDGNGNFLWALENSSYAVGTPWKKNWRGRWVNYSTSNTLSINQSLNSFNGFCGYSDNFSYSNNWNNIDFEIGAHGCFIVNIPEPDLESFKPKFVTVNPTFRTSIIKKVVFHYGISHQVNNFSSIII
jgi:hypothetical protein